MNEGQVIGFVLALKVVKISLSYAALLISKNYTSQIYTEKVYVRQENPPKLINMLALFLGIELVMTIVTISCLALLSSYVSTNFDMPAIISRFSTDYVMYLLSMFVHGVIVSNVMYSKKFFLYKDDGLRAIRAYSDILLQFSIFNGLIPFDIFVHGIVSTTKKLGDPPQPTTFTI